MIDKKRFFTQIANYKIKSLNLLLIFLLITDLTIIFDISIFRQIFGCICFSFLPGLLIIYVTGANTLDIPEKTIFSLGLSIAFIIFLGIILYYLSKYFSYLVPYSMPPIVILSNFLVLIMIYYLQKFKKDKKFLNFHINISKSEMLFLILPILFPALSVFGTHMLRTKQNNSIVLLLILLIIVYIILLRHFKYTFPSRLYPLIIFLFSISLILLYPLRTDHILIGSDTGAELFFYRSTLDSHHLYIDENSTLSICLGISVLPTIYQSLLNINWEMIFKLIYPLIFCFAPIGIFILTKNYIPPYYAFLSACFFIFQSAFLATTSNCRTNLAIFFVLLSLMVLLGNNLLLMQKRIFFIIFALLVIISHYATTYIFLICLFFVYLSMIFVSKKYSIKGDIDIFMLILISALVVYCYSYVTFPPFQNGVVFFQKTFDNIGNIFLSESREILVSDLQGVGFFQQSAPYKLNILTNWASFILIGLGFISSIFHYKKVIDFGCGTFLIKKLNILKKPLKIEYALFALVLSGILWLTILLPFISLGYNINRLYSVSIIILSLFFILGGFFIGRYIGISAHSILTVILIITFLNNIGIFYELFSEHKNIAINSIENSYHVGYVDDQDCFASTHLYNHANNNFIIHTSKYGSEILMGEGKIPFKQIADNIGPKSKKLVGYFYLSFNHINHNTIEYYNVSSLELYNLSVYSPILIVMNEVYTSGDTRVYFM